MTRLTAQPHLPPAQRRASAPPDSTASVRRALQRVRDLTLSTRNWQGLSILPDRKGLRLEVGGATIGRIHLTGLVEAVVGREVGRQLLDDRAASPHPERPLDAGQVVLVMRSDEDVGRAARLLRIAHLVHDPGLDFGAADVSLSRGLCAA